MVLMKGRGSRAWAALLMVLFVPSVTRATTITYDVGYLFGAIPPTTSTQPYVRATFTDHLGGGVDLVMSAVNLSSQQYLVEWLFNVNVPNPSLLTFTWKAGMNPTVSVTPNGFHQGGAGDYDIRFVFPNGNPQNRFASGSTSAFLITGQGVTAQDFDVPAAPRGGQPVFDTLARIQGAGWAAEDPPPAPSSVPEPGPLGLLIAGSALLFGPKIVARVRS